MSVFMARAAEESPGKDELYECSSEKTVFQNLRDWFGMWGRGLFKTKEEQGETEKKETLKRNVSLKKAGISKTSK